MREHRNIQNLITGLW